ncbi:MAG TPA: DUF2891 family protein [Gaiellaceae bacterium]
MSWASFARAREDLLRSFSTPILASLGRDDTPSPIFHGCFDWHSAVHGVWSLYAIYDRTGEELYLDAAAQHVRPELVEPELEYVRRELADEENPYGFAWMLALVERHERVTGGRELRPLGDYAAGRVATYVRAGGLEAVRSDAYRNLSWALVHLAAWARYARDDALLELVREATARHLTTPVADEACPVTVDTDDVLEFMPIGLMRLAAVEDGEFVRARLPAGFVVPPLLNPTTVHANGVDAFRAVALAYIHRTTGLARVRDNVAWLVLHLHGRPEQWRDTDYACRHWVAQIAVRAIDQTYE